MSDFLFIFNYLLCGAIGFLSGSMMYSYLVPKWLFKKDITTVSKDGNPGCSNVFTCIGVPCGILCLLLELCKGAVPVWLASCYLDMKSPLFAIVLAAPVMGHAFSPMLRGRGGKAIAVTFGAFIGIFPQSLLLLWLALPLIFFSLVIRISPNSARVMTSYMVMVVNAVLLESNRMTWIGAAVIAVTVIFKHYRDFKVREKSQFKINILSHCIYNSMGDDVDGIEDEKNREQKS